MFVPPRLPRYALSLTYKHTSLHTTLLYALLSPRTSIRYIPTLLACLFFLRLPPPRTPTFTLRALIRDRVKMLELINKSELILPNQQDQSQSRPNWEKKFEISKPPNLIWEHQSWNYSSKAWWNSYPSPDSATHLQTHSHMRSRARGVHKFAGVFYGYNCFITLPRIATHIDNTKLIVH